MLNWGREQRFLRRCASSNRRGNGWGTDKKGVFGGRKTPIGRETKFRGGGKVQKGRSTAQEQTH